MHCPRARRTFRGGRAVLSEDGDALARFWPPPRPMPKPDAIAAVRASPSHVIPRP
jgi:hypothetical protein